MAHFLCIQIYMIYNQSDKSAVYNTTLILYSIVISKISFPFLISKNVVSVLKTKVKCSDWDTLFTPSIMLPDCRYEEKV